MIDMNIKRLIILVLVSILAFISETYAFEEEDLVQDSLGVADTLRKAIEIDISQERIEIDYDDGSDTLILRTVERGSGGKVFSSGNDIITIGKDELIDVIDSVRGEVVILGGDLEIRGYVKGDIMVAFGDIHIISGANIEGDIACLGTVVIDSGTHIWGDIASLELERPFDETKYDFKGTYDRISINLGNIEFIGPPAMLWMVFSLIVILLMVASITAIMPRPVARIRTQIKEGFIKCFLVGLLLTIALFPIWILILISIIGIPVALLVYPFVVIAAFAIGAIGFTQFAGFQLGKYTTLRYPGFIRTTLAGAILLGSPLILSAFFAFINIWPLAWILQILFWSEQFIMFTAGLGGVFFSRFGTRPKKVRLDPRYDKTDSRGVEGLEPEVDS
jgi:cytoskeletal protein CcmA (bactofilin family)